MIKVDNGEPCKKNVKDINIGLQPFYDEIVLPGVPALQLNWRPPVKQSNNDGASSIALYILRAVSISPRLKYAPATFRMVSVLRQLFQFLSPTCCHIPRQSWYWPRVNIARVAWSA